jgi:hypothetical protein
VPYEIARKVLASLNGAALPDKRDTPGPIFGSMSLLGADEDCADPSIGFINTDLKPRGIIRRQTAVTPGYLTTDDFGSDGDDTPHSKIPSYSQPNYIQGNASFPDDGTNPEFVDVIFLDYFASVVVKVLDGLGGTYTIADVNYYMEKEFTTNSYLPKYAKANWQANMPNCPVGQGVGYPDKV